MTFLYSQISKVTEEPILRQKKLLEKITKIKNQKLAHSLPLSPTLYMWEGCLVRV